MKKIAALFSAAILFISCQKDLDHNSDAASVSATVSDDVQLPLPCHTTSFVTKYSASAGQVPPFRFTKTLYSDTRVKSINMLSRAFPNHSAYKKQAYELIGTFTYSLNRAKFTGTRETWEYFKTATGGAGKRSLGKKAISYYFTFHPTNGFCLRVGIGGYGYPESVLELLYNESQTALDAAFINLGSGPGNGEGPDYFYFKTDANGNITENYHVYNPFQNIATYKYDYTQSGGRYNYQPSRYAITYEYNLAEVMQWLPPQKNPRTAVSVQFYPYGNPTFVKQSQTYKNLTYDTNKNLISYTYADNILQSTTWLCR